MLRDGHVPALPRLLALGAGAALTTGAIALDLPVEAAVALLLPALGLAADVNGLEAVAGPLLLAALLLPRLAPVGTTQIIREERALPPA